MWLNIKHCLDKLSYLRVLHPQQNPEMLHLNELFFLCIASMFLQRAYLVLHREHIFCVQILSCLKEYSSKLPIYNFKYRNSQWYFEFAIVSLVWCMIMMLFIYIIAYFIQIEFCEMCIWDISCQQVSHV